MRRKAGVYRHIHRWLVPRAYDGMLADLFYALRFPHYLRLIRRNRELYRRHADKRRCFVIGNGPSLKTQDLCLLKDEITIVANAFFFHPDRAVVAPKYCCVGDPKFIADQPKSLAWLRELETQLPDTTLFFRPAGEALFRRYNLFRQHHVYYIDAAFSAQRCSQVRIDLTRLLTVGVSTGSAFLIPLALYLGFRKIYLIGFDANWLADIQHGQLHFYDTNPYFPQFDTTASGGHMMERILRMIHKDFMSHRLLLEKATAMGVKILNATNGGWLDMYPRVPYETLFE